MPEPTIEALNNQIKMHKREITLEIKRGWQMNREYIIDHLNWIVDKSTEIHRRTEATKETKYYVRKTKLVEKDNVVKLETGRKYVAAKKHELPDGAEIISDVPHGDGDYSYICGFQYCRCTQ